MRVFVLCTGRSGSVTIARALEHTTNFTAGHETLSGSFGDERFAYPDQHIEVDNRLSWFLGDLHRRFPDAFYVHLTRDPEQVASSFAARWDLPVGPRPLRPLAALVPHRNLGLMRAFANGLVMASGRKTDRLVAARFLVDAVTHNIEHFLEGKEWLPLRLETARDDLPAVWDRIGAEGELDAALAELDVRHNARPA